MGKQSAAPKASSTLRVLPFDTIGKRPSESDASFGARFLGEGRGRS